MLPVRHSIAIFTLALCVCAMPARAQDESGWAIQPVRLYAGTLRNIPVTIASPSEERREAVLSAELELVDPSRGPNEARIVARTPINLGAHSVDLAGAFPVIWTARSPRVLYCQLYIDNEPTGAPLVVEPLLTRPAPPDNMLEAMLNSAYNNNDTESIDRLINLSEEDRARLRALPAPEDAASAGLLTGVRVYPLPRVVMRTTQGTLTLRVRPDAAPRTVRRFVELVEDGYYTDLAFHRVVRADENGRRVLVQTGDPTGTGAGTPGQHFDFEPSSLRHAYGVLSMARDPERANSNGAQFFICLSDAAGVRFDGKYTAFAEIVEGADALEAIVRTPLGRTDPDDPDSPRERPLEPVTIISASLTPAPPMDPTLNTDDRIRPEDQTPVVR